MEDVPQPADEPYPEGARVRVYLGENDPDAKYHGRVCVVEERLNDALAKESGRQLDAYLYCVQDADTGETLGIDFRHRDLVPTDGE